MVIGVALATVLALGASGAAGAHWDRAGDEYGPMGPGMMGPGMLGGHGPMGPGMMTPGVLPPQGGGPGMMGPGTGPYPHDVWDD
jgi:hypothetical protein